MQVVAFRYFGKVGHFLRAEANANGITYPVPSRTVLLGLIGNVLGLKKDEPQVVLKEAQLAVAGEVPQRFWHKTNVRKDPPVPLPYRVKRSDKGNDKDQRNFRFPQEWLWQPNYKVWASLPQRYQAEFAARLQERRWHFTPCLGLAWMLAQLEYSGDYEAVKLPVGTHAIVSVVRQEASKLDLPAIFAQELTVQSLRMPAESTADRVFTHRPYWLEYRGRPVPIVTSDAWRCGHENVVFL